MTFHLDFLKSKIDTVFQLYPKGQGETLDIITPWNSQNANLRIQ